MNAAQDQHLLVMVLEDDAETPADETLIGCVAYERGEEQDGDWFIKALAVQRAFQRRGNGSILMNTCLGHLAEITPGGTVYWHVVTANQASRKMCQSIGAIGRIGDGYQDLMIFAVRLPGTP